jgi:hypothetical protein
MHLSRWAHTPLDQFRRHRRGCRLDASDYKALKSGSCMAATTTPTR